MKDEFIACFEAGIKLGAVYHQFVGMPLKIEFIKDVERLMEESIKSQPYVVEAEVRINEGRVRRDYSEMGYSELRGEHLTVKVVVEVGKSRAEAILEYNESLRYPLMRLLSVTRGREEDT